MQKKTIRLERLATCSFNDELEQIAQRQSFRDGWDTLSVTFLGTEDGGVVTHVTITAAGDYATWDDEALTFEAATILDEACSQL